MNGKKIKVILRTAIWLAVIVGSVNGLLLTISGYLIDWGPGGSMEGPLWRVLMTGGLSALTGIFIGFIITSRMIHSLFRNPVSNLEYTIRASGSVLAGSEAAFVASWVIGYATGHLTGAIEGLDWKVVLLYTPLMSFIYSLPVCLTVAAVMGIFTFFYLKSGGPHLKNGVHL